MDVRLIFLNGACMIVDAAREHNTRLLNDAAGRGQVEEVARLIPISNPTFNSSEALLTAARMGYAECVELLIPVSDCTVNDSLALRWAARYGYEDCIKLLRPVSNLEADGEGFPPVRVAAEWGHDTCVPLLITSSVELNSGALHAAAARGHTMCVQHLLPVSNPALGDTTPLEMAARGGHLDCVQLLLPVSPPGRALALALVYGEDACAEVLYPHSDLQQTLQEVDAFYATNRSIRSRAEVDAWLAAKQNQRLTAEVAVYAGAARGRKM